MRITVRSIGSGHPRRNGWGRRQDFRGHAGSATKLISWFQPLDPANGTSIYMMVVNGLSDPTGTVGNCLQQIKLNFVDSSATANLYWLDSVNGVVKLKSLPLVGTRRQLLMDLSGGGVFFFKFNDGAPFIGY